MNFLKRRGMKKSYMLKKQNKTKFFEKIFNFISDNFTQISETVLILAVSLLPFYFDFKSIFSTYLQENYPAPDNAVQYFLIQSENNIIIAIALFLFILISTRKYNKDKTMNRKNIYHDYPLFWYWYCARVLGYKKCNLVLVPIPMLFKLVHHGLFEEYPLDENSYPEEENETIKISKNNWTSNLTEVNIILEDTYPILDSQIPCSKNKLPTIKISRNDGKNFERHFSQQFIENVITQIRSLNSGITVNVFATINPLNSLNITKRAFTNGNRGNIDSLFVFQQEGYGERLFKTKGKKIF